MLRSQAWRGEVLKPLLESLTQRGVTADQITLLSAVCGLGFCPAWLYSPIPALMLLALHVLLDGVDGPLARFQKRASLRGSFTDTMADQVVIFATTLTLMTAGMVDVIAGGIYLFVYTVVVALAMVRNSLRIPYSWLVRPRFLVYAAIPADLYLFPGAMNLLLIVCDVMLTLKLASGFYFLRRKLGELETTP